MDEFLIEAVSLKSLEKVRVGHDSSGPGSGWFLDKVVIKDPEDNTKEYVFPCNRFGIIINSFLFIKNSLLFVYKLYNCIYKNVVHENCSIFSATTLKPEFYHSVGVLSLR